jgi:NifU-like protein involved in Fe-S cluster formation
VKYNELTRRHFDQAAACGVLSGPGTFRGAAGSRAQGTWVQFDLQAAGETRVITAASFLAFGCPHVIAVAAWLAEQAVGRRAEPVLPESVQSLRARFDAPVEKLGRLLIVEDAWISAMRAAMPAAAP